MCNYSTFPTYHITEQYHRHTLPPPTTVQKHEETHEKMGMDKETHENTLLQKEINITSTSNPDNIIQFTPADKSDFITDADTGDDELFRPSRLTYEICAFLSRGTFPVYLAWTLVLGHTMILIHE